jgi:hypothetical protein
MLKRLKAGFSLVVHITLAIVLLAGGTTLRNGSKNEKEGIFKVEVLDYPITAVPPLADVLSRLVRTESLTSGSIDPYG